MKQNTADYLMGIKKKIVEPSILIPATNEKTTLNVQSLDKSEMFQLDINRAGCIKISRCTMQERYGIITPLVRLDLDETKKHQNPDQSIVVGPHLHVYKEGYGDRWAYALSDLNCCPFTNITDLMITFMEFCKFCNIEEIPVMQGSF